MMTQMAKTKTDAGTRYGDYELLRLIGRGSSGAVWEASNGSRQVAIKFMNPGLLESSQRRDYFRQFCQEIHFLNLMTDHPRTPLVLDTELRHMPPYFVMSLIEGASFAEDIASGEMQLRPIKDRLQRLFALAATIDTLHKRGILHRDIKPGNIRGWTVPHLVDFSVAIFQDKAKDADANIGTPLYRSPFVQDYPGVTDDHYAFALVCYDVVFGRHALFIPPELDEDLQARAQEKLNTGTWYRPSQLSTGECPIFLHNANLNALDKLFEDAFLTTQATQGHGNARNFVVNLARIIASKENADYVDLIPDRASLQTELRLEREHFTENEVKVQAVATDLNTSPRATHRWFSLLFLIIGIGFIGFVLWQTII